MPVSFLSDNGMDSALRTISALAVHAVIARVKGIIPGFADRRRDRTDIRGQRPATALVKGPGLFALAA